MGFRIENPSPEDGSLWFLKNVSNETKIGRFSLEVIFGSKQSNARTACLIFISGLDVYYRIYHLLPISFFTYRNAIQMFVRVISAIIAAL